MRCFKKISIWIAMLALAGGFVANSAEAVEPVIKAPPNGTKLTWYCDTGTANKHFWVFSRDEPGNVLVTETGGKHSSNRSYFSGLFLPGLNKSQIQTNSDQKPENLFDSETLIKLTSIAENPSSSGQTLKFKSLINRNKFEIEIKGIENKYIYGFDSIVKILKISNKIYKYGELVKIITWYYSPQLRVPISIGVKHTHKRYLSCSIADYFSENQNFHSKISSSKKFEDYFDTTLAKLLVKNRKLNRHAIGIIIGNKQYKGHTPEVSFAHNDADAIKDYLLNWQGYREGNIIDLRDASQAELMAVFGNHKSHEGKLFNYVRAGKSDVTVFYSGHGVPGQKDRRGYLLPVDADPNLIEINGYPIDVLFRNLALVPAKSMSVFLDACFSGDSPKGMIIRATSGLSVTPKMPANTGQMVVLTAAQGDQYASWDEDAEQGLFTKHLLAALKGAADKEGFGNGNGEVTLAEVQKYLDDEMTYQARRRYGRRQRASVQGDPATVLIGHQ
jgi:hypothetical protein